MYTEGFFLLVITGLILIVQTEASLFPEWAKPDLALVFTIWMSFRAPPTVAAFVSFLLGLGVDVFSGGPAGLFAVIYTLVFLIISESRTVLETDTLLLRSLTVFTAALAVGIIVVAANWAGLPAPIKWAPAKIILRSCASGLASMMLFPLLDRGRNAYLRLSGV
jgi:rod shape-determining protein MreD